MGFSKISEIQTLSKNEIEQAVLEIKTEIIDLKVKQATKQKVKPHVFKHKKHKLAQLLMLEKQKESE